MDIKSKKSSKLAKFIIALVVLIPAFLLVALYPRMEKLMLERQENIEKVSVEVSSAGAEGNVTYSETVLFEEPGTLNLDTYEWMPMNDYILSYNFVNYVAESSFYLYGQLLQEAEGREVNFEILDAFGWINDFYSVSRENYYYAVYTASDGNFYSDSNYSQSMMHLLEEADSISKENLLTELKRSGVRGYLTMEFDPYGKISKIDFQSFGSLTYQVNLYDTAKESLSQFQNNEAYYLELAENAGKDMNWAKRGSEVIPKNFKVVFAIPASSSFIYNNSSIMVSGSMNSFSFNQESFFWDLGVWVVVVVLAGFVALMALVLPFFKKLNTGWEKWFCMPVEIMIGLGLAGFFGALIMSRAMCHSTLYEVALYWKNKPIMGYPVNNETVYGLVLAANYLGWAILFLAEYSVVAAFRQFLCHPILFLKERFLVVMLLKWIFGQIARFFRFMTDVDLTDRMQKDIFKLVLMNFLLIAAMCCGWFVGIFFAAIYSVIMYRIFKNKGMQMRRQYESILHATEQMAEGELKLSLQEELGVFEKLGRELELVQEGFSKAVAEEAKSQHMKTELISHVSHDLKTPLTAIITYIDLLKREENLTESQRGYVQTLEMKAQRLKVLIEDLFEVSKAQSGNIQLNKMDVDIVSLMKQLRLEMEDKIADSDLSFRWNLPEEKVILNLDGQKTYRIFENLLGNALKYALPGSRVFIDILNEEDKVQVVYKNTSATELSMDSEQLTERFVRGDASRNSEGSGLGLAIVKSFTEIQDGEFKIEVDGDLFKALLTWKK